MSDKKKAKSKEKKTGQAKEEEIKDEIKDPMQELTELLKRTQANFENYRKQTEKRIEDNQKFAAKDVITKLLPIIDNFELALKNTSNHKEFIEGVELIYSQFMDILKDQKVEVIDTEGEDFDPYKHEALMKVESDQPENQVIEVFHKGFVMHNQVIRHAKVKVSAGKK